MLNKELLMAGKRAPREHILMTVGEVSSFGRVGLWPDTNVGSVNKVPYWNFDGFRCALKYLLVEEAGGYTISSLFSSYQGEFSRVRTAEQGTADDRRRRGGVVDSTLKFHRGLLYRSNPVGLNRSDAYPLGRTSEQRGYCSYSNTSKEYPTTYTKCRNLQGHNPRWVYSRRLLQTQNSNHSVSKRGVSRGVLQSVTSKEALYA